MIIQLAVNGVLMKKIEKKFQKNLIFQKKSHQTKPNTQNILKILLKKSLRVMLALLTIFGYVRRDKRPGNSLIIL